MPANGAKSNWFVHNIADYVQLKQLKNAPTANLSSREILRVFELAADWVMRWEPHRVNYCDSTSENVDSFLHDRQHDAFVGLYLFLTEKSKENVSLKTG